MIKIWLLLTIALVSLSSGAKTIKAQGESTKDGINEACNGALENARENALNQSGINVFSNYKSIKTIDEQGVIKKSFTSSVQSSYGVVKLVKGSMQKTFKIKEGTESIHCQVTAKFQVDTSKLKAQLKALVQKHKNEQKAQELQAKILREKERLLEQKSTLQTQYNNLQKRLKREQKLSYNGSYICDEEIALKQCKKRFLSKIESHTRQKMSQKYDTDKSDMVIKNLSVASKIKVIDDESLSGQYKVAYKGDVNFDASLKRKNAFAQEIQKLDKALSNSDKIASSKEDNTDKFQELKKGVSSIWERLTSDMPTTSSKPIFRDKQSRLRWVIPKRFQWMSWKKAIRYCKTLRLNDHTDWRVPTLKELKTLTNIKIFSYKKGQKGWKKWFEKNRYKYIKHTNKHYYFIKKSFLKQLSQKLPKYYEVWSSDSNTPSKAWNVRFNVGSDHWSAKDKRHYVLCVR